MMDPAQAPGYLPATGCAWTAKADQGWWSSCYFQKEGIGHLAVQGRNRLALDIVSGP